MCADTFALGISQFFELFGVRRPVRYEPEPIEAGEYDHALHSDQPDAPSLLEQYLDNKLGEPKVGGAPSKPLPAMKREKR